MRHRLICFFIILSVCFYHRTSAQRPFRLIPLRAATYSAPADTTAKIFLNNPIYPKPGQFGNPMIPADYYTKTIGFFCTKELQVEKAAKFPLRFRLGSVNYCDGLEGKNR
ncbi:hypothetical protein EXU57_23540 [Segetibacter sp. 3557_3]|uniref:hypothetical protein n=1 Tax=Segetibacter sp. 3557_3 TaxID=2547429 RepID=UPI001058FB31|nr:hypothetical protein [Segetibacter sp. 3557_3]TDH18334.1 hypothetical protein EXU57_23540 [Segetibacter sp. 3557_3]